MYMYTENNHKKCDPYTCATYKIGSISYFMLYFALKWMLNQATDRVEYSQRGKFGPPNEGAFPNRVNGCFPFCQKYTRITKPQL